MDLNRLFSSKFFSKHVERYLREKNIVVLNYGDAQRRKVMNLINQIKREREMLLRNNEAYQLYLSAKAVQKIEGDIAEVGVYQGGSAKLLCHVKGAKALHLFDTFAGIPKVNQFDHSDFYEKQFAATLDSVKKYLINYENVLFHKGIVPESAEPVKDKRFSFVHLDVDTYTSTLDCLRFFYPRMNRGSIIISHDYFYGEIDESVSKAIIQFFEDKPEPIIELAGSQCLIVKI